MVPRLPFSLVSALSGASDGERGGGGVRGKHVPLLDWFGLVVIGVVVTLVRLRTDGLMLML